MRNVQLAELAKRGEEAVQNSHTLRVVGGNANLAFMQCGSYVATSVNGKWIADTMKGDSERKSLSFSADYFVILASGDKGSLARLAKISECGQFALFGTAIVALGTYGKLKLSAYEKGAFIEKLKSGDFNATEGGVQGNLNAGTDKGAEVGKLYGIEFCTLKNWKAVSGAYASLAYSLNGKLAFRDIETKKNCHNDARVLVSLLGKGSEATAAAQAVTGAQIAAKAKAQAAAKAEKVRKGKGGK